MRKNYIDNLRWVCVIYLISHHTFMVYSSFGEDFYVKGVDIQSSTKLMVIMWPWFMPLLFLIVGVSSAYALKREQ